MNNIINEYIGYLENLCGFAKGTLKQHLRICKLWTEFLTSTRDKKLFTAEPIDLLHYIELRQKSGKVKKYHNIQRTLRTQDFICLFARF